MFSYTKEIERGFMFEHKSFDKSVIKLFLDYCHGIEGCLDNLPIPVALELFRFLAEGKLEILKSLFLDLSNRGYNTELQFFFINQISSQIRR